MANDAKFNFYINRQGPRGQRGEKGDQGFSPSITVNTNTADEYTLLIQNEYDSLVTDNIRPTYDDRGGTYVRVDRTNNVQYFGSADIATTANYGEVKLAQASDLASTVDVGNSNVITVELLKTWFGGQIADNLVTTTNNVTIQGQKIFATPTRFMDTVRIGNRLMVAQEDTGTITFDTDETGTVIGTHLTSTDDANFSKNVTVDGTATIEGGLNVAGNAVISNPQLGNTTISGDLTTNADINIQGQKVHLQHTNPTMYLKNMNGVNEIEIFRGLFTAGNPSPADNYLNLGHSQLQLNLTGKAIKANGKDVATADTVNAIQSDLNIAKQDIIEAQGDIDNLQMNKQNKLTAGTGITIDADNVISATGGVVDIPIASSTTLGGIKVGENLTISEDGTLSATGGGGGSSVTYTAEAPLSISADNVISIDTTDLGGTTLKKDARMNVDYALDLTANGTVGGTSKAARAESNESRHDAYMAFSGHNPSDAISTLWGPNQRKAGSWVELYLPDGVVPYSAAWTYGSTDEILPAVELLASNDGSLYKSLGSVTGVSTVTASMTFNTTDSYKYLRFNFRDACVSSDWGKFGLTSLKVQSGEVATYTELFIGDNIDVTNGTMNVNLDEISSEVNALSGDVTTLSSKVTAVEGKTTDLESAVENKQDKLTAISPVNIATKVLSPTEGWVVSTSSMQSRYKEQVANDREYLDGDKTTMHLTSDSEYPIKSYVAMPYSVGQVVKYRQNSSNHTNTTLVLGDIIDGKIYPILINSAIGNYRPQYTTALFDGTQELTKEVMTNGISYSSVDDDGPYNQPFINEATFGCLQNTGTELMWHVFTPRDDNHGDYGNLTYTNFNGYTIDDLVGKIKYAIILAGDTSLAYTPDQFGVYENTLSSYCSNISDYQALSPNLFDLSKNEVQTQISTLPATTSSLGVVKPDGTTITITDDGTISAVGGGGGTADSNPVLDVPVNNCVLAMPTAPTFDGTNVKVYAGTKVAIPNGLNADGTCKSNIVTLTADATINQSTFNGDVTLMLKSDGTIDQTAYSYFEVDDISTITTLTAYCWYYDRKTNNHYLASSTGAKQGPYQRIKIGSYNQASTTSAGGKENALRYFRFEKPLSFHKESEFNLLPDYTKPSTFTNNVITVADKDYWICGQFNVDTSQNSTIKFYSSDGTTKAAYDLCSGSASTNRRFHNIPIPKGTIYMVACTNESFDAKIFPCIGGANV